MSTEPAKKTDLPAALTAVQGKVSLMARVAERYAVDQDKMKTTLIATAFRQRSKDGKPAAAISDEQLMMLLVVADQYKLNPFTREIFAFPSEGGIVAIVSVDGWIRIINERSELKSISFELAPPGTEDPWIACTIERTDRSKPVTITEYLSECSRDTGPWKTHPRRMLRHKALIQCARVAFGFAGIFDPDEGERIVSIVEQGQPESIKGKPKTTTPKARLKQDPPPADPIVEAISVDQANALADKLDAEGVDENALLARFEIGQLTELSAVNYAAAMEWIEEAARGG